MPDPDANNKTLADALEEAIRAYCTGKPDKRARTIVRRPDGSISEVRPATPRSIELARAIRVWEWVRHLPQCPPTRAEMDELVANRTRVRGHRFCIDTKDELHSPSECFRSISARGWTGQQCCYYGGGLVTRDASAGTPDRVSLVVGVGEDGLCENAMPIEGEYWGHAFDDRVLEWLLYQKSYGLVGISPEEYFMVLPPSRSDYERYIREVAEGLREPLYYGGLDLALRPRPSD